MKKDSKLKKLRKLYEKKTRPILTVSEIAVGCKMANSTTAKFIKAYELKRSPAWFEQLEENVEIGRLKALVLRQEKRKQPAKKKIVIPPIEINPIPDRIDPWDVNLQHQQQLAYQITSLFNFIFCRTDAPPHISSHFAAPGRHYHSLDTPDSLYCPIRC